MMTVVLAAPKTASILPSRRRRCRSDAGDVFLHRLLAKKMVSVQYAVLQLYALRVNF